eukprot:CAMPEP_0183301036 /NCGR_PEP_ID=MMETSP0160_2-20130417/7264_1 /TAXON_ID=2839 ORGANISM="Odontella Sinensis, Strain Grunow 1884" /NCGR_SAMPLE_ID=MMETSP0160_2 /ASSEMBLY_ACC=CAM_ASM_000250 /LENGTH=294 /DNA_ID=CAMNT_0025463557 /DNA_START=75 /DNA_END=959 /DNA_ORIENTATION=-
MNPFAAKEDDSSPLCESWRQKICEWCFDVVDHYKFDREVVSYALNYLDRSVAMVASMGDNETKVSFQLKAMTCLYLAIKLHGETNVQCPHSRIKLSISTFSTLSRGMFSTGDIEKTEREILQSLSWMMNPPTPVNFVAHLLHQFMVPYITHHHQTKVVSNIYDQGRYLTELCSCTSELFICFKPSVIAFASILFVLDVTDLGALPMSVREAFVISVHQEMSLSIHDNDLKQAGLLLARHCPDLPECFQTAVSQECTTSHIDQEVSETAACQRGIHNGTVSPDNVLGVVSKYSCY